MIKKCFGKISLRLLTGKAAQDAARQENVGCLLGLRGKFGKYGIRKDVSLVGEGSFALLRDPHRC